MANYYVSATRGSDSTGTGTATNPWKTVDKAIGSGAAITLSGSGDTLYIEPGIYREAVTLGLSPTSGGPLSIVGDCDGAGFLAGGYSTPATGLVDWRAWTDDLAPITTSTFRASGKSYVTMSRLKMLGGQIASGGCVYIYGTGNDWTFRDCVFVAPESSTSTFTCALAGGAGWNLTVERCDFFGCSDGVILYAPFNTTEYDLNSVFRNCRAFTPGTGFEITQIGGTGSSFGTGVRFQNCMAFACTIGFMIYNSRTGSVASPIVIELCSTPFCGTGVRAGANYFVAEDYNILDARTPRTNVDAGAHSITSAAPALDFGDARLTGLPYRPFGEPSAVSPYGAFTTGGTPPSVDLLNRARPEGTGSLSVACGPLERHDTGVIDTTYEDAGSGGCMALVGPSSHERPLLVDAAAVTASVKVRWDGNHGDANKPQALLLANPEIGVAAQTVTATSTGGTGSTPNSYETLTFSSITPTAPGVVMLRMVSRSAAGNGVAYFDTITLS